MDFTLSEEQEMLRDSARRFISEQHPFEIARKIAAGDGMSREHWRTFADLGWLSLLVAEDDGGLGLSMSDVAIMAVELGRGLVAAPFVSNAILGTRLIGASQVPDRGALLGRLTSGDLLFALAIEEVRSRYDLCNCATVAERVAEGFRLDGKKILVHDGAFADTFLITARLDGEESPSLFLVPANTPGIRVRTYTTIDSHRAADLVMEDAIVGPYAVVLGSENAVETLHNALDEARVVLAAEAVGAMEAAMAMTGDYLNQRKQFGRPLAEFQSLTHRLADMYVTTENARAMVYRALSLLDADGYERSAAVSATMVAVTQAGEFVGGQSIQLHGGIGMAEEYAISHYYKRLRAIAMTYGDHLFHVDRYQRWSMSQGAAA